MLQKKIITVPTNIITGFLGAGKTSAILHLLKYKPKSERWAVLVNEFGEIGVDGSLMVGEYSEQHGVYIQEVSGGCMCCAAGVSMQVALNQLLKRSLPDRLLIEPTGLGHPKEVLKMLSAAHYQTVLALQKTITLVDARNLSDQRYTTHDIFNQQIAIADTVIGNKMDVYRSGDKEKLVNYVKKHSQTNANVYLSHQGNIKLSHLAGTTSLGLPSKSHHHETKQALMPNIPMPECGFIKAINTGEGFRSIGWRFSSEKIFNYRKLQTFLTHVTAERIKAVFSTELGMFGYNVTADGIAETVLNSINESLIEIISQQLDESLEAKLMACIIN
jgi:G3E family GTPase